MNNNKMTDHSDWFMSRDHSDWYYAWANKSDMTKEEICLLREQLTYQRVLVTYMDDQEGQDIREEDVVRPSKHQWSDAYSHNDGDWVAKSRPRCPMYGSCQHCYRSRPVGMFCYEHQEETPKLTQYMVVNYFHHIYRHATLGSIIIAEMLGAGHETAKADRTYAWLRTPTRNFDCELINIRAKQMYQRQGIDPAIGEAKITQVNRRFLNFIQQMDTKILDEMIAREERKKHNERERQRSVLAEPEGDAAF
jgi:hypothetical protein